MHKVRQPWDEARLGRLRHLWEIDGKSAGEIADELGSSRGAVYQRARTMGLTKRQRGRKPRNAGAKAADTGARIDLPDYHPAVAQGRTVHGSTVKPAALAKRMLKSGKWSHKIGDIARKGKWKGFPLFTLTLEERATCPRSCLEWRTCYGNNLGHTTIERIFDDGRLYLRLEAELVHQAALYPDGFAVRLHVLGDFFSIDYVNFWCRMLRDIPGLHLFGFTARLPGTPIGDAVVAMMQEFDDRSMMRFSGGGLPQLCSEVVDTVDQARFIPCPAQHKVDHDCARCGLCWTSDHSITFLRH